MYKMSIKKITQGRSNRILASLCRNTLGLIMLITINFAFALISKPISLWPFKCFESSRKGKLSIHIKIY